MFMWCFNNRVSSLVLTSFSYFSSRCFALINLVTFHLIMNQYLNMEWWAKHVPFPQKSNHTTTQAVVYNQGYNLTLCILLKLLYILFFLHLPWNRIFSFVIIVTRFKHSNAEINTQNSFYFFYFETESVSYLVWPWTFEHLVSLPCATGIIFLCHNADKITILHFLFIISFKTFYDFLF